MTTLWDLLAVVHLLSERREAQIERFEERAAQLPLDHPHAADLRTAAEKLRVQIICLKAAEGTLGRHSQEIVEALRPDPSEEETAS